MPGIVGFVDFSRRFSKDSLQIMIDQIRYSGRYVVDKHEGDCIAMGRADLPTFNPMPQPFLWNHSAVFFQGDLRNKRALLDNAAIPSQISNAEIVARQYSLCRTEFVRRIKGQFATAIWDSQQRTLFLINDRFGKHQIYLWLPQPETLFFASEVKCLVAIARDSLELNMQAIVDFLQFQHLLGDETYFKNITLLPYASVLKFSSGGLQVDRYWHPNPSGSVRSWSGSTPLRELHERMSTAILGATGGRQKVGTLLSGGLDTRNIAAHLTESRNVHSFTYGHAAEEDVGLALLVAKERNFTHHYLPLTSRIVPDFAANCMWLLEGNGAISTSQNMVILAEAERNGVELILDGIAGAPIFPSPLPPFHTPYSFLVFVLLCIPYIGDVVLRLADRPLPSRECYSQMRRLLGGIEEDQLLGILSNEFARRVSPLVGRSLRKAIEEASSRCSTIFNMGSFLQLTQYVRRALVNTQNCCRWKIELVDALLDYDLVEFGLALPYNEKLWRKIVVEEMKTFHQSMMRIPLCSYSYLMSTTNLMVFVKILAERVPVLKRFMKGEARPVNGWADFLRDQREFIEGILFNTRAVSRGLLDQERLGIIVREHMSSRRNHTRLLTRLISLELWFRLLEDKYGLDIFHI